MSQIPIIEVHAVVNENNQVVRTANQQLLPNYPLASQGF